MSKFNEVVRGARDEVNSAIEALEAMPRSFGGHLSKNGSSALDAVATDAVVIHQDGRAMRLTRALDPEGTPYATSLCNYRGRWIVVPSHKLRRAA